MKQLEIKTRTGGYPIYVGNNIRHQLTNYFPKKYSSIWVITDTQVAEFYLEDIKKSFMEHTRVYYSVIKQGEQSKSFDVFYQLHTTALQNELDRNALIIALGGGVIGDVAGFVASTYLRGIDYIQVPTSILAHDSSVGGKVAINHPLGKNLIGSFYSPQAVIYDVQTLQSLPVKEVRSGYAELVKEGLIGDTGLFENIMKKNLSAISTSILTEHLLKGIQVKKSIVQKDEKEQGIRAYLNFGHTLAHAIEAESGYGNVTHGEAVAIGMLFALEVSESIFKISLPTNILQNWMQVNGYPLHVGEFTIENLLRRMKMDKKAVNRQIQMVLLEDVGKPVIVKVDDDELEKYLRSFMDRMMNNGK